MKRLVYFLKSDLAKTQNKPKPDFYRLTINDTIIGDSKDWRLLLIIANEIYKNDFFRIDPMWSELL